MSEIAYEIREKMILIRFSKDESVKRKLSLELGELQHRLTLFLRNIPRSEEINKESTLGDRVAVLGK